MASREADHCPWPRTVLLRGHQELEVAIAANHSASGTASQNLHARFNLASQSIGIFKPGTGSAAFRARGLCEAGGLGPVAGTPPCAAVCEGYTSGVVCSRMGLESRRPKGGCVHRRRFSQGATSESAGNGCRPRSSRDPAVFRRGLRYRPGRMWRQLTQRRATHNRSQCNLRHGGPWRHHISTARLVLPKREVRLVPPRCTWSLSPSLTPHRRRGPAAILKTPPQGDRELLANA